MALDYHALKRAPIADVEHRYDARDTILYALGIGVGEDPLDERLLRHVLEPGLVALPTFATVLGYPFMWIDEPRFGLDAARIVHAGHTLRLHAPLPAAGTVRGVTRAVAVADKGADRGALIVLERTLSDASGTSLATQTMTLMARGDGGFSARPDNGPPGGDAVTTPRPTPPDGPPAAIVELATLPQQALIYRLVADPNPLHADPRFARAAGFDRPILHGLCTYGLTCRAVLSAYCGNDPSLILSHDVRFSSPVFPGETVSVQMWRDGNVVSFEARVKSRDVVVIKNGKCVLAG